MLESRAMNTHFTDFEYEFRQSPRSQFGGYVDTFRMKDLPIRYSVYCPRAVMGAPEVDVMVFAHGLLDVCQPVPKNPPEDLIAAGPFQLGKTIDDSGRALVLIAPLFEWKSGPTPLAKPGWLNTLVAEAQQHVAELLGAVPSVTSLILAGHSKAYSFLEPLARSHADPQMQQGALARLSEVWMLDTTYGGNASAWMALLASKPALRVRVCYIAGSPTAAYGKVLRNKAKENGRLLVTPLNGIVHCKVPGSQLPGLLSSYSGGGSPLAHELDSPGTSPPLRQRIVETAEAEWQLWKNGTLGETNAAAVPLLTGYWSAVGESVKPEQLQSTVWQASHPWSAAFVSYVMRRAGAGHAFGYAAYHTGYIVAAKRAAAKQDASSFQAFRIDHAPLEPGDVVCHDRQGHPNGPCAGTNFENAGTGDHMISHGEIVLEVHPEQGYAITIGGNTSQSYPHIQGALRGNTVGKHKISIGRDGVCVASQGQCPYFAVLKPPREASESQKELPDVRRWSWLSPDAEWHRQFSPVNMEEDIPDPSRTETRAIRITVIGHASARWRGAGSQAERTRLNEALSNRRADNVRAAVEQILRQQLPTIPILPGSSPAPGQEPAGVQLGAYGVGSREPLFKSTDPKENDPRNRSVQVLVELTTTEHGVTGASRAPRRISAITDSWYVKVVSLKGGALGAAGYRMELNIRNPLSNKVATYTAILGGGGVGGPISLSGSDLDSEYLFTTSKAMGFDDFDGEWIRVERAGASLGIKAIVSYLTFTSLGNGAALLPFQRTMGISLSKPNLEGFVVSGKLSIKGQNPGNWYEVDGGTDTIPFAVDHHTGDGLVLTFPTGKAGMRDIKPSEHDRLRNFITQWARQV